MSASTAAATPCHAVLDCLEQFSRTLAIAHSLVCAGRTVDLAGLEAEMGFVCARALDLPPEEGRALRPALKGLRGQVDALCQALSARHPRPA